MRTMKMLVSVVLSAGLLTMVDWMDKHPEQTTKDRLALVYAWNEIGEGGGLVPCRDDPNGEHLKVIRRVVLGK